MSEKMHPAEAKRALRKRLAAPGEQEGAGLRCPRFEGEGRAAQRLRGQPEYRAARVVAVMAEPALLQVRINCLADKKLLVAGTPGLKQGLVRVSGDQAPLPSRSRVLRGGSLVTLGAQLHFPQAKLERVDLLVVPAVAADPAGNLVGDGRGLSDLLAALLARMGSLGRGFKIVALLDDAQMVEEVPSQAWDAGANLLVTPTRVLRVERPSPPAPELKGLSGKLVGLPLVQAIRGMKPVTS